MVARLQEKSTGFELTNEEKGYLLRQVDMLEQWAVEDLGANFLENLRIEFFGLFPFTVQRLVDGLPNKEHLDYGALSRIPDNVKETLKGRIYFVGIEAASFGSSDLECAIERCWLCRC